MSDISPKLRSATELSSLSPGDSVAIFGVGPVGMIPAHSAFLKGASRIVVVDARDAAWTKVLLQRAAETS